MPIFEFAEMPEEIKQKIREQHELHQMQAADYQHALRQLFASLDLEQMMTLRKLLGAISSNDGSMTAVFYDGALSGIMETKFDVCSSCGVNHEKEFLEELAEKPKQPESQMTESEWERTVESDVLTARQQAQAERRAAKDEPPAETRQQLLDEYNLLDQMGGVVMCKGCQMMYPSLEDRMLKKPDDCSGCHNKARWG